MDLTPEQKRIVAAAIETQDNICINALAGTGKTTLLEHISAALINKGVQPNDILMLCFATRNKKDFDERMPEGIHAATFNSIGFKAWIKARGVGYFKVHKNKTYATMRAYGIQQERFPGLPTLISLAKNYGYVPPACKINNGAIPDPTILTDIIHNFDIDCGKLSVPEAVLIANDILLMEIYWSFGRPAPSGQIPSGKEWKEKVPYINYDDQIYMSVYFGGSFEQYSNVLVDEAQDLSLFQHDLIRCVLAKNGRFFMVGDPNQAIYAFRGAMPESFETLRNDFNCTVYPITINFRCSHAVIKEAQELVPDLKAWESARLGSARFLKNWNAKTMQEGDAILCRYNAPLVSAFFALVKAKIPCAILGRDLGKSLEKIVEKNLSDTHDKHMTEDEIKAWLNTEVQKARSKNQISRIGNLEDQAEILYVILEEISDSLTSNKRKILQVLEQIFSSEVAPVTLSSIHKAKGFEWENVYILNPSNMPSRYARLPWEIQQEYNLKYVAKTRAKNNLYYFERD